MKKKYRYTAFLLALIFIASQLLHVFHDHSSEVRQYPVERSDLLEYSKLEQKRSFVEKSSFADHHCVACFHFAHHFGESDHSHSYVANLILIFTLYSVFYFSFFILKSRLYSLFLLRGPPSIVA
ncbi:hypothetical protein EGY07_06130 [Chryseobacterium indologenes]|nr:hypothetical protein EGY07_06130 [Chryseobacterium indologenes]